ncbi:Methionine biosynthesis protein MetW [Aequorivita sublithincola DSM 14238]|uniref:Methionine biosynthesis protein MetW n=1 Tax=Aequorivita sublithincola (strain DSM 14238 / LMG 21431 / ACAM 643 / 9-3) TaxID=746697 RepID=I3YXH4_AEQSU|nr:class I SAM-dependent methyltransferase [Aequorivita sublithincola]AFL81692.1 Methionine biosynthesis protein MetW [Aequorivita sublithincola DSM 14238]
MSDNIEYNKSYIGLRQDLLKYIEGKSNIVLDVGCALGINGKFLLDSNIADQVYGIEYDFGMARQAEKFNTKVFCGDLNDASFIESILNSNNSFDYIIFGDILEHLFDPLKVLAELKSMLKPHGTIIISVPNIGHIELFIQIFIKGTWPKNERGIFDKTHLRWFTRKDVFSLAGSANLEVIKYERKFRARDAIGSRFTWKTKLLKLINKDLVTFQHIIVCKHA